MKTPATPLPKLEPINMMTLEAPTALPSLAAYRQTVRSCYMSERCLHPIARCTGSCRLSLAPMALPLLAPGVLDGPYRKLPQTAPGARAFRVLLLALCVAVVGAVLVQLFGVVV